MPVKHPSTHLSGYHPSTLRTRPDRRREHRVIFLTQHNHPTHKPMTRDPTDPSRKENLGGLAEYLKTRMPNDKVTSKQLRDRSWWTGAEAWVLVDDYDLVALQGRNPVAVLQPLMAQAQDVGLHVMVVRRMGGASRAAFEPVLQAMRDLGTTGILMSGSPDEGAIIGRIKPMKLDAGRAQVISRDAGNFLAQLVWSEPNT